jgi:hypothetical protein
MSGGTGDLLERLAYLALAGGAGASPNSPPLVTYSTTPSATGDFVRATSEFRAWFDRHYGTKRDEVRRCQGDAPRASRGVGIEAFKPIAP